ncbi:histidinol-phosphate transaminase [Acidihalobacter prosperus]|uniref:Histidinol-phosphate aminotransferase n=1 Tax=Acidihalobacter prosperus TaxID=160660 RepID=A0A1A6C7L0_9GAMM|nr:histidinol-phosphate transaminase [Acidihalobacter prosperus]OBS10547.1 histidinol-phosphate transaminase [Acidihalobacter prosperus]
MSRFWSDLVAALTPYTPGEQPRVEQLVKLNTNENPYPPSPAVLAAIRADTGDGLRLYPDPEAGALKTAIAQRYALDAAQVFVGNGSDEVLAHTFCALLKHARPILFPDVTYSFYPTYCGLYGVDYRPVPLDAALRIDPEDYAGENGGVIFPNPNAPTGRLLPLEAVRRMLDLNPDSVVVVDEAYIDFGGESAAALVPEYPNLLVIQTLSKSRSLAGLRVGFALGQAPLIEGLERVKNSFNSYPLGRLAIAGAVAAMADEAYFERTRQAVIAGRERLTTGLESLGFEVLPSAANFVFARHPAHRGESLAAGLRAQRVLVRHFRQPRIEDYLRITVGTDAQCERLLEVLEALCA